MGLASKTLIVAPFGESVPLYREALKNHGLDIDIITVSDVGPDGGREHILKRIKRHVAEGKEIIIARGTVAGQVRRECGARVVELEVTDYDVMRVLKKYIGYPGRLAVVECGSFTRKVERIARLWDLDLTVFTTSTLSDLRSRTLQAVGEGFPVIIGGAWGEYNREYLEPYDVVYEQVGCSQESVLDSVERAFEMYRLLLEEKRQKEILGTIIDFSVSGIVAVDRYGFINTFNTAAQKQLGLRREAVMGKAADQVLPQLRLGEALQKRVPDANRILQHGDHRLVVTNVPLLVDREVTGAVSTFQKLTDVEDGERKIRSQLAQRGLSARYSFGDVIGESGRLREVMGMAESFSQMDSTILLTGETGTGKEIFAQSIHNASPRRDQPFVAVNCSALPGSLLESELFGYTDGAFTGARKGGKIGIFELAHKGTIFLDEIGEIDRGMQVQLLRVLQEKEVRRIGDDKVIPIDVRVVAATNKDLYEEVLRGNFRSDLFFRLSVLNIHLPPLRERKEDLPLLADFSLRSINARLGCGVESLAPEVMEAFFAYDWPGNIRELQNTLEKMAALVRRGQVTVPQVETILRELRERMAKRRVEPEEGGTLDEMECRAIRGALAREEGNRTRAAKRLGVDRSTLFRKMEKYGIRG